MFTLSRLLTAFSGVSFLTYGVLCLRSPRMQQEFRRFGLSRFRTLTGTLEVLGGVGQLIGLSSAPIFFVSTTGLTLLMGLGLLVRIKIKDRLSQLFPALFFMILNAYLLFCPVSF